MAVLTFSEILILITLKERHTKCQLTIFTSVQNTILISVYYDASVFSHTRIR